MLNNYVDEQIEQPQNCSTIQTGGGMHLFAYGTLMCQDIFTAVTGLEEITSEQATITGYVRYCVRGEHYPAIVENGDGVVEGRLYYSLSDQVWTLLDRFEGAMYVRTNVVVHDSTQVPMSAQTYVVRDAYRGFLEKKKWSFENFNRYGKERFMNQYGGFRHRDET